MPRTTFNSFMPRSIQLRLARTADSERVAELFLASRKVHVAFAPLAHSDGEVELWVRNVLIASGGVTVALVDDTVVGMLAASRQDDVSWIDHLYVDPSFVNRGVGSQLLGSALVALPRPVRFYTFQENSASRRFYERRGFVAVRFSNGSSNEERCPDVLYELPQNVDLPLFRQPSQEESKK
jgi:GNAT superfamily N-acetyltransferase